QQDPHRSRPYRPLGTVAQSSGPASKPMAPRGAGRHPSWPEPRRPGCLRVTTSPLTVVLPTYNRRHILVHTLPIYLELARHYPLLVIDDGSTDGTAPWLAAQGVRVVRHPRRLGLPTARNTGLRVAVTEWVFFGEDDVLLTVDHPAHLHAWAAGHRNAAAV